MCCISNIHPEKSPCKSQCDSLSQWLKLNLCDVWRLLCGAIQPATYLILTCTHINGLCLFPSSLGIPFAHLSMLKPAMTAFDVTSPSCYTPQAVCYASLAFCWVDCQHLKLLQAVRSMNFQELPTSRSWLRQRKPSIIMGQMLCSQSGATVHPVDLDKNIVGNCSADYCGLKSSNNQKNRAVERAGRREKYFDISYTIFHFYLNRIQFKNAIINNKLEEIATDRYGNSSFSAYKNIFIQHLGVYWERTSSFTSCGVKIKHWKRKKHHNLKRKMCCGNQRICSPAVKSKILTSETETGISHETKWKKREKYCPKI